MLEGYFLSRNYVTLTLQEFRNLPSEYAWKLYIILRELDIMAAEKRKREMDGLK